MRKISLKNLGKDEILTLDELKQIMGGVEGSGQCGSDCSGRCNTTNGALGWCTRKPSGGCVCASAS